jgi:hypothetical protein
LPISENMEVKVGRYRIPDAGANVNRQGDPDLASERPAANDKITKGHA